MSDAANPRSGPFRRRIVLAGAAAIVVVVSISLYCERAYHPVIFYYGGSPEVAQGAAFAILNPFRNRKDESNAEWLIRDLRTERCEEIARHRLAADPGRICPIMIQSTKASLIWLDAETKNGIRANTRDLWYDLPQSRSRLVVHFANSEVGWGVNTVELFR